MSHTINWSTTREAYRLIAEITDRAVEKHPELDRRTLNMDLTACHANGMPLKLAELLLADEGNFWHDVAGISRHINRETGRLEDCFVPRFHNPEVRP